VKDAAPSAYVDNVRFMLYNANANNLNMLERVKTKLPLIASDGSRRPYFVEEINLLQSVLHDQIARESNCLSFVDQSTHLDM
jgi:hypothetical protein